MKYVPFGKTDLFVSRVCLGTMTFGHQTSEEEATKIMDAAAAAGVNFIDTADGYPMGMSDFSRVGRTEEIVGRWLSGKRDKFVVATKVGAQMSDDSSDQGGSRTHIMSAIDGSLRRLRTDYIDLYQMHLDDKSVPPTETLEALGEVIRAGKARYIGISNIEAGRLREVLDAAEKLGLIAYISVQPRYNMLFREPEEMLLPLAVEKSLAVMPYNPLAGGLLSGRYVSKNIPEVGRFSDEIGKFAAMYRDRYWNDRAFEQVAAVANLAREAGIALPTIAIAWVLANPAITSAIVGASRSGQLGTTLAAADFVLPSDLKCRIDQLTQRW